MFKKIVIVSLIALVVAIVGAGLVLRIIIPANTASPIAANAQGAGNQFRGGGQGQGFGAAASNVQMTTAQGNVLSVDQSAMTVQTSTGEKIVIQNRPWTFALEQKFTAKVDDQIKMTGFYQNGQFEIAQMQNLTDSSTVQVRDQSGRPGWAGRGGGGAAGFNTAAK